MKSPILLIFVFAMIYCFEICGGADIIIDVEAKIRILTSIVQGHVNNLKTLHPMNQNLIRTQMQGNMKGIRHSAVSQLKEYAQSKWIDGNNLCISFVDDELSFAVDDQVKKFDDYIRILKPRHNESRQHTIQEGEYIIAGFKEFLSNDKNKTLPPNLYEDYLKFENDYIEETKANEDISEIHDEVKVLTKQLREAVESLVSWAKKCMDEP